MKLFCSNAFTGEDFNTVSDRMQVVVNALNKVGHEAYCPIFDPYKIELQERQATKDIFDYAFQNLAKCDGMVAIITSDRRSEGQLMEIGAILAANKPLFLFVHDSANEAPSHLQKLATKVFNWSSDEDLASKLADIE
jgi:nucleoside 2-deoxyribosyltransferase